MSVFGLCPQIVTPEAGVSVLDSDHVQRTWAGQNVAETTKDIHDTVHVKAPGQPESRTQKKFKGGWLP